MRKGGSQASDKTSNHFKDPANRKKHSEVMRAYYEQKKSGG